MSDEKEEENKPRSDGWPKGSLGRSYSGDMVGGVLIWVAGLIVVGMATAFIMNLQGPGSNQTVWPYWIPPILVLIGEASLTWHMLRKGSRGFLPGLLLGVTLTCLIPTCICGLILSTIKIHP